VCDLYDCLIFSLNLFFFFYNDSPPTEIYTLSLHDALPIFKAMPFPVIEVHLSNLATREEWRHHSIISPAVKGTVQGLGWRSYTAALRTLVEIVREPKKAS